MYFFLNVYKDGTLSENFRHIYLFQWPDKWQGRFYDIDVDRLQTLDSSVQGLTKEKSKIPHLDAAIALFASRKIGKCEMDGYYYCSLVYTDLTNERHNTKTYGKAMKVTAKTFWKWENELLQKIMDKDGVEQKVWMTKFSGNRYINDARYLPGDITLQATWL